MSRVYCQQVAEKDLHHTVVRKQTTDALLELYSHVVDMPDGPTKHKFLQQVVLDTWKSVHLTRNDYDSL